MESRPWEIYTLADPRTMAVRYVGITFRGKKRLNEHLSRAVKGGKTHRDCWIRSLLSAGVRPALKVVQRGNGEGWQAAECDWISRFSATCDLVNHTKGGDGTPGYVPTPELRQRWSKMRSGLKYPPGRVGAMLGKHHSPEARRKIARAGTGRRHRAAAKRKISAARKGKPLSAQHRERLSEAHAGKVLSEVHKRKIATSTTNRKPVVCVETGRVFASGKEAMRLIQVSSGSLNQAIRKGFRCKGYHFRFA